MNRFSDAASLISDTDTNLAVARRVYDDFAGCRQRGGLSLSYHGDYVIVDDEADRWIATTEDYACALTSVIADVIAGKINDEDSDCYDALCHECGCIYSRIGHPSDESALLVRLRDDGTDEVIIAEICEELGIDQEAMADAE